MYIMNTLTISRDQFFNRLSHYCSVDNVIVIDDSKLPPSAIAIMYLMRGDYHRLDGPAVQRGDGSVEYYINGTSLSKKDYYRRIKLQRLII